jgi:hypothetical protein
MYLFELGGIENKDIASTSEALARRCCKRLRSTNSQQQRGPAMRSRTIAAFILAATLTACASSSPSESAREPAAAATPARTAAQIPMEELMDKPAANAVFKKHAPDLAANPQLSMARGMSLADVAGYSESGLTPTMVKAIVDDVNKL